ncbi:alpha/beta fold hydrolase [Cellulosimicrobium sp. SH8]|uniref:alpha/beta fold hydrolase n=1 Tax=Cellulosimicrobium sp. SH8 TaxID=2952936 RepID=UPI0021F37F04|nr:lysophospholipase [Cellulosimicrobium sp. SH8]
MSENPLVVLLHGAFAESASWSGVIARLRAQGVDTLALANPLRSVVTDAQYVRDAVGDSGRPLVLVAHSYGGMVVTEAAAEGLGDVRGIVYAAAFAPDTGESAIDLAGRFPGSTLGDTLESTSLVDDQDDLWIRPDAYHAQFAADVAEETAYVAARTQRPVTDVALNQMLLAGTPAWKTTPSWFVFGSEDRTIPVAAHRWMAERAAARGVDEVDGGSHAIALSEPDRVVRSVLDALDTARGPAA